MKGNTNNFIRYDTSPAAANGAPTMTEFCDHPNEVPKLSSIAASLAVSVAAGVLGAMRPAADTRYAYAAPVATEDTVKSDVTHELDNKLTNKLTY